MWTSARCRRRRCSFEPAYDEGDEEEGEREGQSGDGAKSFTEFQEADGDEDE